ncbi:MAG: galactokinase [Actinomycetota bacterium]|nr:galactokinase [Actinomycetota bacterium]
MHVVRAPGRVNLIGDHTDYQDGFCLPVAIDREVVVRAVARSDGIVVARSDALEGIVEMPADGFEDPRRVVPKWGRSVAGVLRLLSQPDRPAVGFDADVTSTVPVGSGLSSSAAFAVAFTILTGEVAGYTTSPHSVAWIAQAAEQAATGVPCGLMDQMASVFGRAGHALLLDCRNLDIVPVPLPDSVAIVVVHTGLGRRLEDSAYAQRRAACEAAATRLGVDTLRDATIDQVVDDPIARHVVSENRRTLAFVDALRTGDLDRCGRLMDESHASLRDDFRVSTPELDVLVDALVGAGAYGARLTGAGFGGCAVALVRSEKVDEVATRACSRYVSATGLTPTPLVVRAVDGAGPVE